MCHAKCKSKLLKHLLASLIAVLVQPNPINKQVGFTRIIEVLPTVILLNLSVVLEKKFLAMLTHIKALSIGFCFLHIEDVCTQVQV